MDQKQIIHIASEVVVISGLAIYFKLKTNSLSNHVDELKKRIITQEQLIEEFKNTLDEHSLLFSKQEILIKQLQHQLQNHKQKSRPVSIPKQKVGIVWDSETDSSYFPEEREIIKSSTRAQGGIVKNLYPPIEQKVEPPIERNRARQTEQKVVRTIEKNRVKQPESPVERNRVKQAESPVERNRVPPIIENLDEELQNELLELEESKKKTDSENSDSEIIEIDTSLKKKA